MAGTTPSLEFVLSEFSGSYVFQMLLISR